jgi:hypothetical protein
VVTLHRIVLSLLVSAAVILLAVAFSLSGDEGGSVAITDVAVEARIPPPGDVNLRQARIGVDLAPGYTGVLLVDGTEIPEDQLVRIEGLNQVFYTPGPGTETGPLSPGRHRITAVFWPVEESRQAAARQVSWEFNAH